MVQKPEALYITAPSPMLHTTGRSGAPSCAPTAAPMPCPSEAPKLRTRRHWRLSKPRGMRWSALRKLSETTSVPSGSVVADPDDGARVTEAEVGGIAAGVLPVPDAAHDVVALLRETLDTADVVRVVHREARVVEDAGGHGQGQAL